MCFSYLSKCCHHQLPFLLNTWNLELPTWMHWYFFQTHWCRSRDMLSLLIINQSHLARKTVSHAFYNFVSDFCENRHKHIRRHHTHRRAHHTHAHAHHNHVYIHASITRSNARIIYTNTQTHWCTPARHANTCTFARTYAHTHALTQRSSSTQMLINHVAISDSFSVNNK